MKTTWIERNTIVANLFNPAFCGEILRISISNYNKHTNKNFPFALSFLILPILLHKGTRDRMPRTVRSYFFVWVEENDDLFYNFPKRTKGMVKYTKEAISFLLANKKIEITELGDIIADPQRAKQINNEDYEEYNEIIRKAEMLGKWLTATTNVNSIYSFFRITP